jgi:spermidine synthase
MPEHVARLGAEVDVAEIDPAVIETGRRYFKLDEFPQVHAHASDARLFLQRGATEKYDLIFGDAYNGRQHIPAHLVTREFFELVQSRLNENGVFLINIISAVEGDHAVFLSHFLPTIRSVFPEVQVFAVSGRSTDVQNVILLASMKPWKAWLEDRFYAQGSWQQNLVRARVKPEQLPVARGILTDDWNPVDAVIARQLDKE